MRRSESAPSPSATIIRRASSTMTWRVRAGRMGSASQPMGGDAETAGISMCVRRPAPRGRALRVNGVDARVATFRR